MHITRKQLRKIIKESFISGRFGTVHVPDEEPGISLRYHDELKRIAKNRSNPSSVNQANALANTLGYEGDFSRDLGAYNTKGQEEYETRAQEMSATDKIKHTQNIVNEFKTHGLTMRINETEQTISIGSFDLNTIYKIDAILKPQLYGDNFKRKGVIFIKIHENKLPKRLPKYIKKWNAHMGPNQDSRYYQYNRLIINYT